MPEFILSMRADDDTIHQIVYNSDNSSLAWNDESRSEVVIPDNVKQMFQKDIDEYESGKHRECACDQFIVSPDNPATKSHDLRRVRIQLGLACNMRCQYCFQRYEHHTPPEKDWKPIADEYLKGLPTWCTIPEDDRIIRFEFWGGEPLLYWDLIKYLALNIEKIYPTAHFSMVTNGHLFDMEVAKFCTDHNFTIAISHDGPAQYIRGKDPLTNPKSVEAIKWFLFTTNFQGLGFNTVLHKKNRSLLAVYDYIKKQLELPEESSFNVTTEELLTVVHEDARNLLPSKEETVPMIEQLSRELLTEPIVRTGTAMKVFEFIRNIILHRNIECIRQSCGQDQPSSISTDLHGNVSPCNNVAADGSNLIGSVYDFDNIRLDKAYHWKTRGVCRDCPIIHICRGACMLNTGKEFDDTCRGKLIYNLAVMTSALFIITGMTLASITSDKPMHMFSEEPS